MNRRDVSPLLKLLNALSRGIYCYHFAGSIAFCRIQEAAKACGWIEHGAALNMASDESGEACSQGGWCLEKLMSYHGAGSGAVLMAFLDALESISVLAEFLRSGLNTGAKGQEAGKVWRGFHGAAVSMAGFAGSQVAAGSAFCGLSVMMRT